MRKKAPIAVLLALLGLGLVVLVNTRGTVGAQPSETGLPGNATVVRQVADTTTPADDGGRSGSLFGGRIPLPWTGTSSRRTRVAAPATQANESAPRTLEPIGAEQEGFGAQTPSIRLSDTSTTATPEATRLQRRLKALRSGDADSHSPRTAVLPRPINRFDDPRPTPANPQDEAPAAIPGASVLSSTPQIQDPPPADRAAAIESELPSTAPVLAPEATYGNGADALPSILRRNIDSEPDGDDAQELDSPAVEPPSVADRSTTRQPPEEEALPAAETFSPAQTDAETAATRENYGTSDRLFTGSLPTIELETIGPQTVVVGKEATFIVRASNLGQTPVTEVSVEVRIPASAELRGSTASGGAARYEAAETDPRLQWKISRLVPNRPEELVLKMVPRDATTFELAATWSAAPAEGSTQIRVLEPKLEMRLVGPPDVLFGDTKFYVITISNPGTGTAENVAVNLLPINDGEESPGQTTIGSIEAGSRKEIEIELTARQAGNIQIRAQASADGDLRVDALQEVLVRRANLEVAASGPEVKYAGTMATYHIELTNSGDAMAERVEASATLPAGSKYVVGEDGGQHEPDSGRVSWVVGALRPGQSRTLDVQCVLSMAGENKLTLTASAAGDLTASQQVHTTVEALADLKLQLNDPKGPVPVGEDVDYEVKIMNRGTKAAEDITLIVYFSEGLEPLSAEDARSQTGSGQPILAQIEPGQIVFNRIPQIAAGEELVFQVRARADRNGNHICRAELECQAPETRLANEETTRFYGTPRSADAPLEARRSPTPAPLAPQEIDSFR